MEKSWLVSFLIILNFASNVAAEAAAAEEEEEEEEAVDVAIDETGAHTEFSTL